MFREALAGAPARRFFAAHAQSCLGTGLSYVALPLLAYDRFDSAWAVSAVLLPDLLPAILLGPLLGALVDRVGWRVCASLADVLRCVAFLVVMNAHALPWMIAGAALAGLGTALFHPAALTGLPRLTPGDRRPAGMGLFSALDDLGLTVGPALAAVALVMVAPGALMLGNAVTFAVSALLIGTLRDASIAPEARDAVRARVSLLREARVGIQSLLERPQVRTLLASSTGVVLCVGVTNVGEVVLARDVLDVGGSGLAMMVTAGGVGTGLGSLASRFTRGSAWLWRRAYLIGLGAMVSELLACAVVDSFWLVIPALAVGGFGNGLALVHDRLLLSDSTPESLHGRLFALQKTCVSLAFAVSILAAGAVIVLGGVQLAFLLSGLALLGVASLALPRLRAAWPRPTALAALPATR
ncbi:MFS transporter [Candidatus Solirubrobacter pratensis]|uniref:MFS transporter n=1 Tax=Candidatus Solirubrobacter pratensis TaxID=1298857 RepID=UPI00055F5FA8|nr:MFS transporter [Candidatus Solirubrobacter pratensis]